MTPAMPDIDDMITRTIKTAEQTIQPGSAKVADLPKNLRLLRRDELVRHGDYVAHDHRRMKPWEGPGGFRADAFLHPIYRGPQTPVSKRGRPD